MPDEGQVTSSEAGSSRSVATAGWGLLLIWIGTALLLRFEWGVGLVGAGTIVLAAQLMRRYLGLAWETFGIVAGVLLVACGVWSLIDVSIRLFPLLCIGAGIALLVSTWVAKRPPHAPGGQGDLPAASHPRA